eukprot:scaffold8534_cov125-Isochrysis_galbana.AAC.3
MLASLASPDLGCAPPWPRVVISAGEARRPSCGRLYLGLFFGRRHHAVLHQPVCECAVHHLEAPRVTQDLVPKVGLAQEEDGVPHAHPDGVAPGGGGLKGPVIRLDLEFKDHKEKGNLGAKGRGGLLKKKMGSHTPTHMGDRVLHTGDRVLHTGDRVLHI